VGGVVTMFSMLSGSLSAAISRFLTFELGKGDYKKLHNIFSSSVTIQIAIVLVIMVLAETIGLWFLNEKMVIPSERLAAANWCYQFSIITFAISLISVPYNAAIIAHERMSAFAYISILEALGRLSVAWCILQSPIDRLIFYGGMVALVGFIIFLIYIAYCKKHFDDCTYHFIYDHALLTKQVGSIIETISELERIFIQVKKLPLTSVIQIAQMNRNIEAPERINNSMNHFPMRSDLSSSDAIFQASDYVLVIHRPEILGITEYGPNKLPTANKVYMHILKNRDAGKPCILEFENDLAYNNLIET
jgi:hypothetical protein